MFNYRNNKYRVKRFVERGHLNASLLPLRFLYSIGFLFVFYFDKYIAVAIIILRFS